MLIAWTKQKQKDLTNLSIEDLMNFQVTSVSKNRAKPFPGGVSNFRNHSGGHSPLRGKQYSGSVENGSRTGRGPDQRQYMGGQCARIQCTIQQ